MIAVEAALSGAEWRTTSVSVSAAARAHSSFEVGLPQLSLRGLSENWLWKECGQQHWSMLASDGEAIAEVFSQKILPPSAARARRLPQLGR